jgi:hypothetical protein
MNIAGDVHYWDGTAENICSRRVFCLLTLKRNPPDD